MGKYARMRELGLEDLATITMPMHIWHGVISSYEDTDWDNCHADTLFNEVRHAVYPERVPHMPGLKLNDEVAVTLKVKTWHAFLAVYNSCQWSSQYATVLYSEIQEALMDPVYVREQEAAHQQHHAEMQQSGMLGGLFPWMNQGGPQVPPNPEGLEDPEQ
jgi:hypothetical protein